MFPLRDKQPSPTRPWITVLLILLNAAVFAYELSLEPEELEDLVRTFGLTPAHLADARFRAELGLDPAAIGTFFTSQFLHGGILHAASNLWFLWIFGDNVEDRFGHLRYLAFYLLCGAAAGAVQVIFQPHSTAPMIGASGAIAGVMGAYLRLYPRGKVVAVVPVFIFPLFVELPAVIFLGFWFLLQLFGAGVGSLGTEAPSMVAFWAHVGGFVAGLVCVPLFRRRPVYRT